MNETGASHLLAAECFPALNPVDFHAVLVRWDEPHRRWHGRGHLHDLLFKVQNDKSLSESDREMLRYVALFHDAIYDPLGADNEEMSAQLAGNLLSNYARRAEVLAAILATKAHVGTDPLVQKFNEWDCAILCEKNWAGLIAYEQGISFEYRDVDPQIYRRERSKFLRASALAYGNPMLEKLAAEVAPE